MNEIKQKLSLDELEVVVGGVASTDIGKPYSQSVSNLEDNAVSQEATGSRFKAGSDLTGSVK